MSEFYAYVTDRIHQDELLGLGHQRVFTEIYEAKNKDQVKQLILRDFPYMPQVREKMTPRLLPAERYITTIFELNDYWRGVWLTRHKCIQCLCEYTRFEKTKFQSGGNTEFCSRECHEAHRIEMAPTTVDNYNTATVYVITHKPTGRQYVGVTTRWIMQRWWEHIKARSGSPFHQLVQSSDIREFTFEILEVFKPSELDPYVREAYWIDQLDAVQDGLNAVSGHKVEVVDAGEAV